MNYVPSPTRYDQPKFYRRSGRSVLNHPIVSLGLWHNFGGVNDFENARAMLRRSFDLGITHFDLANNYGPPPGSAEANFGRILKQDFAAYRDELIISTKAGYDMWPGPYGDWGSRKYLLASLDQSLRRMNLEYLDIFYSHRPDPNTPIEETMGALEHAVRSGKALYAGLSNYDARQTDEAVKILGSLGIRCLIHQPKYSMFERWIEGGLLDVLARTGVGCIAFSPLAQGLLTEKYLHGIPAGSRRPAPHTDFCGLAQVTEEKLNKVRRLNALAKARGQSLAQLALAWVMRHPQMTTVLIGASSVAQIEENVAILNRLDFTDDELKKIEAIIA